MNNVYALIMAGGKGTRLWPKSKGACPKHMLCLPWPAGQGFNLPAYRTGRDFSLLQETFSRINGLIPQQNILVITTENQAPRIKRQLPSLKRDNLVIEPQGRNTLPAILLGAVLISQRNPDAVMVVLPSDHLIKPASNFLALLKRAVKFVQKEDAIVTVGIKPSYPVTGYGYIRVRNQIPEYRNQKIYKVERFVEKPNLEKAKKFLASKKFFWNGGIFIFRVSKILEEAKKFAPLIHKKFAPLTVLNSFTDLDKIYTQFPSVSIDQAILEKTRDIFMLRANFLWCDLGSWECLASVFKKDSDSNLNMGENFLHKSANSIIINEQNNHLVAAVGLDNIVVVHTPEVTLIQNKSQSQELKNLVAQLEKHKRYRKYI